MSRCTRSLYQPQFEPLYVNRFLPMMRSKDRVVSVSLYPQKLETLNLISLVFKQWERNRMFVFLYTQKPENLTLLHFIFKQWERIRLQCDTVIVKATATHDSFISLYYWFLNYLYSAYTTAELKLGGSGSSWHNSKGWHLKATNRYDSCAKHQQLKATFDDRIFRTY